MKLEKNNLDKFLKLLSADYKIYAPIVEEGEFNFMPWKEGASVFLDGYNTAKPPKDIIFPNYEQMYKYSRGADMEVTETLPEDTKKIIFGIRPCDVKSIDSMDKVFLTLGYEDPYYAKRRENVYIVAMGCVNVSRTCFCESMGLDPNDAPTADVMMNAGAGEYLVLEAKTDKGKELLEKAAALLDKGGAAKKNTKCKLKIKKIPDLDKKLAGMFEHPIWDKVTKACIGCGTCTYVCPSCYCFDIDNKNYTAEGCKYRCWDSCMFSDYTRTAGGGDPRPSKKERLRNRYMHKLCYFNERYGETLCVGCGRCIDKCPAHLDISAFIEEAGKVSV